MSLNGKGINETNELDCLRELVIQGGDDASAGAGDATAAKQDTQITHLSQIEAAVEGATPAGTNLIGKVGIDQTTPGTTNGVVVNGGVKPVTSTYSPSRFQNLGANATLNVKASAGNVFALTCYNANAAARYLLLHNSATVSSGAPLYSFLVPPASQIIVGTDFFTNEGAHFATGIAFGFSTDRDTYTAGTANEQTTVIHYK